MTKDEIVNLRVNILGDGARKDFESFKKGANDVKKELLEMENAGRRNTEEYKQLLVLKSDINMESKKARANFDLENASLNQMRQQKAALNKELNNLVVGSKEWMAKMNEIAPIAEKINTTREQMKNFGKQTEVVAENTGLLARAWGRVKDVAVGALAALSLDRLIDETMQFVTGGIKGAAQLDDAFGKIQKTTGMTKDEVAGMNEEIKKIDTRTAQNELLKIGEVGGQIGVAKDEMLGFVEATDMAVVALGDEFSGGAEEVTRQLAPMKTLFKETKEMEFGVAINKIGSALNELGAAGTATGPVVADFTRRIGQLGDLSPEISQVMGLGASFQELGLTAEISSGGIANIMLNAAKATGLFAEQLGMTTAEFEQLLRTNPNEMLLKLAESFRGMPIDVVVKRMDDLGIKSQEATKVMSLLKDQTDLVREKQELASKAMAEGTSLTREFGIMNNTAAAQLEKNQKALENKRIELGQRLLPAYIQITKAGAAFTGFLAENGERLVKIGGALAAYVGLQKAQILWTERQILVDAVMATVNKAKLILKGQLLLAAEAYTGMTIAETEAQIAATVAARGFNAALMANPFTAVLTVLTALFTGYQVYKLVVGEAQEQQAELNKKVAEAKAPLEMERLEFNKLGKEVLDVNKKKEDRIKILDTLKAKYPLQMKGIDDLADAEKNLGLVIRNTNKDFVTRAKMLENEVKMTYNNNLATQALTERIELENKLKTANTKATTMVTGTAGMVQTYKSEADAIKALIAQKDRAVQSYQKNNADLAKYSDDLTKKLVYNDKKIENSATDTNTNILKGDEKTSKAKGKIKDDELKRDEARFDELFEMQKDQVKRVKELEQEYMKWLEEFRKFRNKQINDAIDVIQKNFKSKEIAENKAHEEVIATGKKKLGDRITLYHKQNVEEQAEADKKATEEYKKSLEYRSMYLARWYDGLKPLQKQAVVEGMNILNDFLNKQLSAVDEAIGKTSDLYEKARLETKKEWLEVGKDAFNTLDQLLQGKVVAGAISAFKALAGALDNWLMSNAREERARLEQEVKLLKEAGEAFMESTKSLFTADDVANINTVYGTLIKMTELPPIRYDMGDSEARLKQELAIGASIVTNYNTAVTKENELFGLAKSNEEQLYQDALDKINKQYDAAIAGINKKYDWEQQMANRTFDLQSMGIQNQTNAELMALVTNNETKLSLNKDFEEKKAFIMQSFADQIKPITADMSQAEIDGINKATDARDKQLAKLSAWLTGELTFVLNNEGQKRKEYSATEQILENGKNRLEQLSIKHAAAEIKRESDKAVALEAAAKARDEAKEAAEKTHLDNMAALAKTHNDTLVALGKAKDDALAESFRILNDIIKNGYDEMIAKAQQAYDAGKITAEQYNEIANRLFTIKDMLGQIDWGKLNVPNFDFTVPKFSRGTEYVDESDYWPDGTDTVPAMLNKGERVLTAVQNKAIGDMSNEELVASALRLRSVTDGGVFYPVDMGLVDRIGASGVPTMGGLRPLDKLGTGGYSSWVGGLRPLDKLGVNGAQADGVGAGGGGFRFAQALGETPLRQAQGDSGDVAGALARNNELMQALVNLVEKGTNEELKRIAEKPPLTLHDVNVAKGKERDARVLSDF